MSAKRILVRSGRAPWETFGSGAVLTANLMGTNTGNFVFTDAAHILLTTQSQVTTSTRFFADARVASHYNRAFDHFVIPLANAFRPTFRGHLQAMTQLISQLRIPVTVLGVGAQASLAGDLGRLDDMAVDIRAFMDAVLERSPSVGVRGEVTYDLLRGLGYTDVEIIGCPSMFTFGADLPVSSKPALTHESKVAITVSPYVPGVGEFVQATMDEFDDVTYIVQDLPTIKTMLFGQPKQPRDWAASVPAHGDHPLMDTARAYFGAAAWIQGLKEFEFTVGTRIHGSIAAALAGVPVVLLAHDSRTLELARYFDIPHVMFEPGSPPPSAMRLAETVDTSSMYTNHLDRYSRFAAFLSRHGLEVNSRPQPVRGTTDDVVYRGLDARSYTLRNPRVLWDVARAVATTPGRLGWPRP